MQINDIFGEYIKVFDTMFPSMCFMRDSEDEIIKKIKKCLKENRVAEEVFDISYEGDILY